MTNDLMTILYVVGVLVSVLVYVWFIFSLQKNENANPFWFLGKRSKQKSNTINLSMNHSISIDEEINALYEQMNDAEGEDRVKLWNRIQELKNKGEQA